MLKKMGFFILATFSLTAHSASVSSVTTSTCSKVKGSMQPFILVLRPNENVATAILNCCTAAKIQSASITGVGGVKNPDFTFFTLVDGDPHKKTFAGNYALDALVGNVSSAESGEMHTHLHAVINDLKFNTISGHMDNMVISDNAEITITPMANKIKRKMHKEVGFEVIE